MLSVTGTPPDVETIEEERNNASRLSIVFVATGGSRSTVPGSRIPELPPAAANIVIGVLGATPLCKFPLSVFCSDEPTRSPERFDVELPIVAAAKIACWYSCDGQELDDDKSE